MSVAETSSVPSRQPQAIVELPIPVFVVNMARDTARRQYMQEKLGEIGITAEFVTAVDGALLTPEDRAPYDKARALKVYGVEMKNSEIGCFLSHYRLYERMVRDGIEMALILEDDISLGPSLPVIVRGLLASSCQDWLVVRLDTKRDQVSKPMRTKFAGFKVAELADGAALYRLRTRVLGTGAYLIRREGAMKMLDYGKRIFMPIDQTMDRYWENGIVPYVVRPIPVFQADTFGSHSGERSNTRRRAQPFAVRQRRRLQRIEDAFRKRLFNVLHN